MQLKTLPRSRRISRACKRKLRTGRACLYGRRIACILSPARLWLLQEAAECCPEGPIKQEIVRALREVSVKMMPSVKSAKVTIANAN